MKVHITNARLAFANGLFTPGGPRSATVKKYGVDLLIEPGKTKLFVVGQSGEKTEVTAEKVVAMAAKEAWKDAASSILASLEPSKKCLRDGNSRVTEAGEPYAGYPGKKYITAKNKTRPNVYDRDLSPLTEDSGRPYSGCYVNATIDVYIMKDPSKRGVFATLGGVQFAADGESFGGGFVAKETDFDAISMGDPLEDLMG